MTSVNVGFVDGEKTAAKTLSSAYTNGSAFVANGGEKWQRDGTGNGKSIGSSSPSSMSISGSDASSPINGGPSPSTSPIPRRSVKNLDTQHRLFGPPEQSPRKVRDRMKSFVFSDASTAGSQPFTGKQAMEHNVRRPSSKNEDTKNRLFGPPQDGGKKVVRDRQKSTLFEVNHSAANTPVVAGKLAERNSSPRQSPKNLDTQTRLFGPPEESPRKIRDHVGMKSSVFHDAAAIQRST